jgi:hypothetical protein
VRLGWVGVAECVEMLGRGFSAKGVVRSVGVEFMGEGVDEGLQFVDYLANVGDIRA